MTDNNPLKMRNIGPKSSAWLRQVGLRTREDLEAEGALGAFMRVKRAGFKPSLNLLYALEGALQDCHWQEVTEARRSELVAGAEAAIAQLPAPRNRPPAGPVTTTMVQDPGARADTERVDVMLVDGPAVAFVDGADATDGVLHD